MHIWVPEQGAHLPHKYGAAGNSTPDAFRNYLVAHPNIEAYFRMDGTSTQKDEVSGALYAPNMAGIGTPNAARLDTMFWGSGASSYNFGVDKPYATLTATATGSGPISGTYRFVAIYSVNTAPYPWYNQAWSNWITVSGVAGFSVNFDSYPGPINAQWSIQRNNVDEFKTSYSGSPLPRTFNASDLDASGWTYTMATLPASWKPRTVRDPVGFFEVGNLHTFNGTSPFTVLADIKFRMSNINRLTPDWNWIVSCFDAAKTEGWGLALALTGYDTLQVRAVRRNAAGLDGVDLYQAWSPQSFDQVHTRSLQMTYDGSALRLSANRDYGNAVTVASTRTIDSSAKSFRIGDGFVGQLDDVIVFNTKLSDANITTVANNRDDVYQASSKGERYNGDAATVPDEPFPAAYTDARSVLRFDPGTWPTHLTTWGGYSGVPTWGISVKSSADGQDAVLCNFTYDGDANGMGMYCYYRLAGVNTEFRHGTNATLGGSFPTVANNIADYFGSHIALSQSTPYWITVDTVGNVITMGLWTSAPPPTGGTPALQGTVTLTNSTLITKFGAAAAGRTGLGETRPVSPYGTLKSFHTTAAITDGGGGDGDGDGEEEGSNIWTYAMPENAWSHLSYEIYITLDHEGTVEIVHTDAAAASEPGVFLYSFTTAASNADPTQGLPPETYPVDTHIVLANPGGYDARTGKLQVVLSGGATGDVVFIERDNTYPIGTDLGNWNKSAALDGVGVAAGTWRQNVAGTDPNPATFVWIADTNLASVNHSTELGNLSRYDQVFIDHPPNPPEGTSGTLGWQFDVMADATNASGRTEIPLRSRGASMSGSSPTGTPGSIHVRPAVFLT